MIQVTPAVANTPNGQIMLLLNRLIKPGYKVLDVGCGDKCYVFPADLNAAYITVDKWPKARPDYLLDLETDDLPFRPKSFDIVQMFDVIEHIPKDRGYEILKQAQEICSKYVFLITPVVYKRNDEEKPITSWHRGNPYNLHKCLWLPEDFGAGWTEIKHPSIEGKYYLGFWKK